MPRYQLTITRTVTQISVAEHELTLPSEDPKFVEEYARVMMHPSMRYDAGGIRLHFSDWGDETEALKISVQEIGAIPECAAIEPAPERPPMPAEEPPQTAPSSVDEMTF